MVAIISSDNGPAALTRSITDPVAQYSKTNQNWLFVKKDP